MVTIIVKELVDNVRDNQSGLVLLEAIQNAFEKKQKVIVSFESIPYISTSFINSAFINLLDDYTFEEIKANLTFKNSTAQINQLIRERFAFETTQKNIYMT